jgi:L-ascorbate metabolism protein UlaG (beta-lactamase superfamily)
MMITKREHACLVIEHAGATLIIDPGSLAAEFTEKSAVAIVVTHEHLDHVTRDHLDRLVKGAAGVVELFGPPGVAAALPDFSWNVVSSGEARTVGEFDLVFCGGRHAATHRTIATVDNLGVVVNSTLYYPGDSFSAPEGEVAVLAVPSSGPWWKTSEAIDFVAQVRPRHAFLTHEGSNSDRGNQLANAHITAAVESHGGHVTALQVGETLTIE